MKASYSGVQKEKLLKVGKASHCLSSQLLFVLLIPSSPLSSIAIPPVNGVSQLQYNLQRAALYSLHTFLLMCIFHRFLLALK